MASEPKFYEILAGTNGEDRRLVEAHSKEQAWRHIARQFVGPAERIGTKRIVDLLKSGLKVEVADEGQDGG